MQHKGVSWSAKGPVANQGNETLWECARRRTRLLAPDCLFLCSMWMEPSMTAKQLTTVHSFLQLEPSGCWNIWLFVFHPQRPLMCAASSCVSVGCEPIRSQLGLPYNLAKYCKTLQSLMWVTCSFHDQRMIKWNREGAFFAEHVYVEWFSLNLSAHLYKIGQYVCIFILSHCPLISTWDFLCTI